MKVVIIGAGVCGTSAAERIRALSADTELLLLGNEPHPLYSRVMLPHYVVGTVPRERVFLKKPEWYEQQRIHYVIDPVVRVDTKQQQVHCASGTMHTYDRLLIAGGGDVRTLPYTSDKLYHLQTIEDADRLHALLPTLTPTSPTAVIGGGFIAMEFLNLFSHAQASVDLYVRSDRFFSSTYDAEQSQRLQAHLQEHGVRIFTRTQHEDIRQDGTLVHAQGEHTYDAIGVGVGLDPDFAWLKDSGIATADGVLCNAQLATRVPHVWTAGDCARYEDAHLGVSLRMGNWMNAQMQGRYVAQALLGLPEAREPFTLVSSYATDVLGLDLVTIGDARLNTAESTLVREHPLGRTLLFVRNERLCGATLLNANADRAGLTALIKAQTPVGPIRQQLQDSTIDLKTLL